MPLPRKALLLTAFAAVVSAQPVINPFASRVLGHPQMSLLTANPNFVEGRELYSPRGVAVDTTATPPILYVSDTLNNRVLGWRNASQFANGAPADIVIGQPDFFTTFPLGPGTQRSGGLSAPTGLAVDRNGNLYVVDSGNNRILRFPRPFDDPNPVKTPDFVIGQSSLTTNTPNAGGRSARTIATFQANTLASGSLVFDAQGNLYFTDPLNNRVLRYSSASLAPGAPNGPDADLVLGQLDFSTAANPTSATDLTRLRIPSGIALDPAGRLYVTDLIHRVLVFEPPFSNGKPAQRFIGARLTPQGNPIQPPDNSSLTFPDGIFFVGNSPYVVDTGNHRILRFAPYENWPSANPPAALDVLGQPDFTGFRANMGSPQASERSLFQPESAVFAAGELFVVDSSNHRLLVFPDPSTASPLSSLQARRVLGQPTLDTHVANWLDGRGFSLRSTGVIGTQAFSFGGGMAVDRTSDPPRLYVADTANNRVLGYRDARAFRLGMPADLVIGQPEPLRAIINYPSGDPLQPRDNTLYFPTGVAVDANGDLWVADTGNGRVLRFPRPFDAGTNMPRANLVLGKPNFTARTDAFPDPSPSNMSGPYSIAFSVGGHLLVSDWFYNRVLFFRKPDGGDFSNGMAAEKVFGQPDLFSRASGTLDNRMNRPRHIATDTFDRLYVCDEGNNRVQIFDSVGAAGTDPRPAVILTSGGTFGALRNPQGIAIGPGDEIWVANTNSGQILRYPRFLDLPAAGFSPDGGFPSAANVELPVALTVDGFGNLLVAYTTNRIAIHYPAMAAVNGASFLPRVAPNTISSLFPLGGQFGTQTQKFDELPNPLPLPTELGGLQVLVNDQPARLYFVSPAQINFLMPMNSPSSGVLDVLVVEKATGRIVASACDARQVAAGRFNCIDRLRSDVAAPALFAGPGFATGTGQVAALNRRSSDGSYYTLDASGRPIPNGPQNPVSRGDIVEIFATGTGFVPNAPPDGQPASGQVPTPERPQVIVGTRFLADSDILYSGLAPGLVGVWQLNIRIPDTVAPSNAVQVVVVYKSIPSNNPQNPGQIVTTIAVKQ